MTVAQVEFPEAYAICKQFTLSVAQMLEIRARLRGEIEKGLGKETNPTAVVKCYANYIHTLPTGKETGKFLALDIGGRVFRVMHVTLNGTPDVDIISKSFVVDKALMTASGQIFFDFIAECLHTFCKELAPGVGYLPLGLCFAFPIKKIGPNKAILTTWTKGFSCPDVVGQDVVQLLQEAIERRGDLKIRTVAIINDTTATLMSSAFRHKNCQMGIVVGTGCNACYLEDSKNVELLEEAERNKHPKTIVNCEWGAFGDNGALDFVRTPIDQLLDSESINPRKQTFEKCTSGLYMGELLRLILIELLDKGVIFKNFKSDLLREPGKLEPKFIFQIESDLPGQYHNTAAVMDYFGFRRVLRRDLDCVRYICQTITKRSAQLVACGIACLIDKVKCTDCSVGIEGGVYRFHPNYHDYLLYNVTLLMKGAARCELVLSDYGAGLAAALVASVARKSVTPRIRSVLPKVYSLTGNKPTIRNFWSRIWSKFS